MNNAEQLIEWKRMYDNLQTKYFAEREKVDALVEVVMELKVKIETLEGELKGDK